MARRGETVLSLRPFRKGLPTDGQVATFVRVRLYDRMQPLYTGEVKVEGIDLNFIAIDQPRPIFDRMAGGLEFDVAEFSSSEFVQRFANKQCPFVAIPVFPSRAFRHGFIAIHRKAGIKRRRISRASGWACRC